MLRSKPRSLLQAKKFSRRGFVLRTSIVSFIIIVLIVTAITGIFYHYYCQQLKRGLEQSTEQLVLKVDYLACETFEQIENLAYQQSLNVLRIINSKPADITHDYYRLGQLTNHILNLKNSHSYIHSVYIYFNQGNVILTSSMGITPLNSFYDTSWFDTYRTHASDDFWINTRKPYDVEYEAKRDFLLRYCDDTDDVFTLIKPLSKSVNSKGGAIVINVYEKDVARLLRENNNPISLFMADQGGAIVSTTDPSQLYQKVADQIFQQTKSGSPTGTFVYKDREDEYLYSYIQSGFNHNITFARIPLTSILEPSQIMMKKLVLIALACLVIGFIFLIVLQVCASLPIIRLEKMLRLNLEYPSGTSSKDELNNIRLAISALLNENKELSGLMENNRHLLKHRTLIQLLQGKSFHDDASENHLRYIDISFKNHYFAVALLRLEDVRKNSPALLDDGYELIKITLFSIIQDCFTQDTSGYTVDIDDMNIAVIFNPLSEEVEQEHSLLHICETILEQIKVKAGILPGVSMGIGTIVHGLENIKYSFRNACQAADYASHVGTNLIISYKNISLDQPSVVSGLDPVEQQLLSAVNAGNSSSACELAGHILSYINENAWEHEQVQLYFVRIVSSICDIFSNLGIAVNDAVPFNGSLYQELFGLASVQDMGQWLKEFLIHACSYIKNKREDKNAGMINKLLEYLNENYHRDISLGQLADSVYMSVPYLSKLFKEYTNTTFIDYITALRISAAKKQLEETSRKIADIAQSVGYLNVQSFIRAFKKYCNMTPGEYRSMKAEGNLRPDGKGGPGDG